MTVSVAIIAFCMLLIMFAVVAVLLRVRGFIRELEKFVDTARQHIPPLMHDVTQISSDVRSIVRSVERDMPKVSQAMESLRATAAEIHELERMVRDKIERPLMNVSAVIGGALRGLNAFWRALLR
jgi:uncharacterized protein YoxC